jgi:hypothetical protein
MDDDTTTGSEPGPSGHGRRARRAARKAAGVAAATAGGVGTVRRGRRVLRGLFRLGRAGLVVGAVGAAVWWAMQRRDARDAYLQGPAEPPATTDTGAGTASDVPVEGPAGAMEGQLVDVRGAARMLDVEESRIPAMVDGGLLEPVGGGSDGMRFRVAEVQAVRLQGG